MKNIILDYQTYYKSRRKYFDRLYNNHPNNNDTGYLFKVLNQDYQLKVAEFVHTAFNHRQNRLHV